MKLTNRIYQISGNPYGTNSSNYVLQTSRGLVMIDAGYSEKQLAVMEHTMKTWGLSMADVQDVLVTHSHFDHAGNCARLQERGLRISIGEADADAIARNTPSTLESLFGTIFMPCTPDRRLQPGEILDYGDVQLEILDLAGHTKGAIGILMKSEEETALFTGDLFELMPSTPQDELVLRLGYAGDPEFSAVSYLRTLKALRSVEAELIAPGHSSCFFGDSGLLLRQVFETACRELTV